MKAALCTRYGPPEVIQIGNLPKPDPKDNEILVRIHASAVNSGDVRVRGLVGNLLIRLIMPVFIGFTKPRQPILGVVYAGVVEEIGKDVKDFALGDEVFGLTGFKFGGHAEYITVRESSPVVKKPVNASFEQAAAIVFGGQTAIHFLEAAKIPSTPGAKVLVYGASGAVGSAAVQLAKHYGAEVTAVCSEQSAPFVQALAPETIVCYDKTDFTKSNNNKFDLVFDAVGKISKSQVRPLLKKTNGIFKTVGGMEVASESKAQLNLLKDLFEKDEYNPCIDKTFTLEEIVEAHRYVDSGRKRGNVVVRIIN